MLPFISLLESEFGRFLTFSGKDHISQKLFVDGAWEITHLKIAQALLSRDQSRKNILDIGANLGSFTIPIAMQTSGNVYSFEPQRIIFQQLCANCFLNRLDNVFTYNLAMGSNAEDGSIISIPFLDFSKDTNIGNLSIDPDVNRLVAYINAKHILHHENVQMRSVDSFGIENVALIKIDVEGYEENVLRGCLDTLKNSNYPPILFEAWSEDWYKERKNRLLSLLKEMGYQIQQFGNMDFLAQHQSQPYQLIIR